MDNEKVICYCRGVKVKDIVEAVSKGAKTLEDIANMTEATTGCGGCKANVQSILNECLATQN